MAKTNQKGSSMYESPQVARGGSSTPVKGGMAPSSHDVVASANARSERRHEMKGQPLLADVDVLPDSAHLAGNEMVGIKDSGYLVKKDIPYGVSANFNSLPPGMDIEDQENADIRKMPMKTVTALGYPGDGWT